LICEAIKIKTKKPLEENHDDFFSRFDYINYPDRMKEFSEK
jgi:hypothetical protein